MAYLKMNLAKVNNESINSFSPIGRSLMNMDATTVWSKLLQFRSWLASRPLDLSFFVTACHNDRQALNNYIEPWAYLPYRCGHSGSSLWSPRFSDKNNGKMGECSVPATYMCGLLRSSLQQWQLLLVEGVRHCLNGTLVFYINCNVSYMLLVWFCTTSVHCIVTVICW